MAGSYLTARDQEKTLSGPSCFAEPPDAYQIRPRPVMESRLVPENSPIFFLAFPLTNYTKYSIFIG